MTLGLMDGSGNVVRTWDTPWDLRTVQPLKIRAFPEWNVGADPTYRDFGYPQYFQTSVNLSTVAQGNYQWVLRVKNPLEATSPNAKKLRFANATQNADGWLRLGTVSVGTSSGGFTSYEAEAQGNTLAGGAVAASCTACSGGSKAGYIGNNLGTLSINGVDGAGGGSKAITIYYASAVARSAVVNGQSVSFPATADWNTVGSVTINRTLNPGANSITFSNSSGWAPDIDRITVQG